MALFGRRTTMKRNMQVMLDGWVKLPKWILNTDRHIVKHTSASIVLCSSCAVFGRIREGWQAGILTMLPLPASRPRIK